MPTDSQSRKVAHDLCMAVFVKVFRTEIPTLTTPPSHPGAVKCHLDTYHQKPGLPSSTSLLNMFMFLKHTGVPPQKLLEQVNLDSDLDSTGIWGASLYSYIFAFIHPKSGSFFYKVS